MKSETWILLGVLGYLWWDSQQPAAGAPAIAPGDMGPVMLPPPVYLPKVDSCGGMTCSAPTPAGMFPDPVRYPGNPGSTTWQGPGVYGMGRAGESSDVKFYFRDQFENWIAAGYRALSMVAPQFVTDFWAGMSPAQAQLIQEQQSV